MAHQCWNDGTDRSTLPIHGMSFIGKFSEIAELELAQRKTFFGSPGNNCQPYGLLTSFAIAACATGILRFEAITLAMEKSMVSAAGIAISLPDVCIAWITTKILQKCGCR